MREVVFPLIPLLIKEAIAIENELEIFKLCVSINSTSYKRSDLDWVHP